MTIKLENGIYLINERFDTDFDDMMDFLQNKLFFDHLILYQFWKKECQRMIPERE